MDKFQKFIVGIEDDSQVPKRGLNFFQHNYWVFINFFEKIQHK